MKKSAFTLLLCLLHCCAWSTTIVLVDNGKSDYQIEIPQHPSLCVRQMAEELQKYLQKVSEAKLPIVPAQSHGTAKTIRLKTATKTPHDKTFQLETWAIDVQDDDIMLTGGSDRGLVYAVCEFLERYADIRWLGINLESTPHQSRILIPKHTHLRQTPAFPQQRFYYFFVSDANQLNKAYQYFNVHNKCNLMPLPQYGFSQRYGSPRSGHAFIDYARDFPTEISWMNPAGERVRVTNAAAGQICYSHPEVRKRFREKLRNYILKDRRECDKLGAPYPTIYDLSANDCDVVCYCPACQKLMRDYGVTGMMAEFTNHVAESIKKDYPELLVQMFAYKDAMQPPDTIRIHDNVIVRLAAMDMEFNGPIQRDVLRPLSNPQNRSYENLLKAWSQKTGNLAIWDYWKMYYEPFANPKGGILDRGEYIKAYQKAGVKSIFIEAEINLEKPESFYDLRFYTALKLMDQPARNIQNLVSDFMPRAYGKAAPPMTNYLNYLECRMKEEPKPLARAAVPLRRYLDVDFFRKTNTWLSQAENLASQESQALNLVKQERLVLDIALLHLPKIQKRLEKEMPRAMLIKRMWDNYTVFGERYWKKNAVHKRLKQLKDVFKVRLNRPPLPPAFQNKSVIDLVWSELKSGDCVKDPQATGGTAMQVWTKYTTASIEDFHQPDFQFGAYSYARRQPFISRTIRKTDLPQDEQYHIYYLGRTSLTEQSILWVHKSWWMSIKLDKVYDQTNSTMTYDIYLSVKFQGPSYVKGSKLTDAIRVDRAFFVKTVGEQDTIPQKLAGKGTVQLPAAYFENRRELISDDHAFRNLAATPASTAPQQPHPVPQSTIPYLTITDRQKDKVLLRWNVPEQKASDPLSYQFYSLGEIGLHDNIRLQAHFHGTMNLSLGDFAPAGTYALYVSLNMKPTDSERPQGPTSSSRLCIDRVVLVPVQK